MAQRNIHMRLSCTQENLKQGLSIASHLPTKNLNLPILHNILLRAQEKVFTLSATNLELAVITAIRGKVDEPGEFTIPGKLFSEYSNLLPQDRVDLSVENGQLAVRCGSYQTKIKGVAATEFPLIPTVEVKTEFSLGASAFHSSLSEIIFAVANQESRPELCGAFFLFNEGTLTMAATDSFRLSEKTVTLNKPATAPISCIVPARTISEVSRILGILREDFEEEAELKIGLSDNQIVFRVGQTEIISRTIEAQYPEYKVIIPTMSRTEILISKDQLLPAVKNAALFSKSGLYDITLNVKDNLLTISSGDQNTGENSISLDVEMTGDRNQLTVNYRYFLDGVQSMNADKIRLKIIDASNPILMVPEGEKQRIYIVMPIKS